MKYNGKNIIFDDDVTLTGSNIGKKLSDVVGELQSKTSKLENYLKWIYKYGGVGGSGSGSGSSTSSDYALYSTLNGIQLSGQTINLGDTGTYELVIKIQKPQGASFSVNYKYNTVNSSGSTITVNETVILDLDNAYTFTKNIEIGSNSTITVTAVDSLYNVTKQVSASYITKSYTFTTYLGNDNKSALGGEMFVTTAATGGLDIYIDYVIAVSATTTYKLTFNTESKVITKEGSIDKTSKSGTIKLDLKAIGAAEGWEIINTNAGYYSATVDITISVENQLAKTTSKTISFSLIPEELYLLVQPSVGTIYQEKQTDLTSVYRFGAGYTTFNVKAYYGQNNGSACTIYYYLNKEGATEAANVINLPSSLRKQETVSVYSTTPGLNEVKFRLVCNNVPYPADGSYISYYYYIRELDADINWPWADSKSTRTGLFNYYRGGSDYGGGSDKTKPSFQSLYDNTLGTPYQQASNKPAFSITDVSVPDSAATNFNTVISLGLKYNEINLEPYDSETNQSGSIILTGYKTTGTVSEKKLTITQGTVKIGNDISIKYYLPKTLQENYNHQNEFHLLNIVSRQIKTEGTSSYYEIMVYVDGIIEGSYSSYSTLSLILDKLVIESSNTVFNLLEISYPDTVFRKETVNGVETVTTDSMTEDLNIFQYYLKFKNALRAEAISDNEKGILTNCSSVRVDNNGTVTCDDGTVKNIATKLVVPTLVMTIQDDDKTAKAALDKGYGENDSVPMYKTTLQWATGNGGELAEITAPYSDGYFTMKVQGTSTRSYKCKNYTLTLNNSNTNDEAPVYLFSPNYKSTDKNTFLPEQSFTLKADVVDSSHSNNTSIGKFVNRVSSDFDTKTTGPLASYIKNCLEGFPMVVYIRLAQKDSTTGDTTYTNYYQGVYNFNLGRESFYNLGYIDCKVFCDSTNTTSLIKDAGTDNVPFTFYSVNKNDNSLKNNIIVAEVQNNSNYFDFSQWDKTILYNSYGFNSESYMFGDFVTGSNISEAQAKSVIQNFVKKVSLGGGYLFGDSLLKKSFSTSATDYYGYSGDNGGYNATRVINGVTVPANQVPNYRYQFVKTMPNEIATYTPGAQQSAAQLSDLKILVGDPANNVDAWLDFKSISEYYTICMAFGLVDSVQKNMNIKTWTANTNTGYGKFYAAFYDMDTSLGINNAGYDVSYFAFSDYWSYDETNKLSDGTVVPTSIVIYRDYSPKAGSVTSGTSIASGDFYDTPSSYIFAIPKYAAYEPGVTNKDIIDSTWPKVLWAKWRSSNSIADDVSLGCLSSAEKFMNNYFLNNLKYVEIPLINMNYRNKYFIINGTENSFNSTNFQKFNGTRVAKVTDWLRGRFHILDAYFNIPNKTSTIRYYNSDNVYTDVTSGSGESISYLTEPSTDTVTSTYALDNNTDIIVLQDIFSGNNNNQGSSNLNINIKTKEYSPLFITTPTETHRYLFGGGDTKYNVTVQINGTQTYRFGGSSEWTYLDSINSFAFKVLRVNSKYLQTLSGTDSRSMSVSGSDISMPSLRELTLTGSNYTGSFMGNDSITGSKFPNLQSVNISKTALSVELKESTFGSLNISYMKGGSVTVANCYELSTITTGSGSSDSPSTTLSKLDIRPVPIALCTTSSTDNTSGGLVFEYSAISSLVVANNTNSEYTGSDGLLYGKSRFCIEHDNTITDLSISGFSQVYINDCPKLQTIYISEPDETVSGSSTVVKGDHLTQLFIDDCNTYSTSSALKIGDSNTAEGKVDLVKFKYLRVCRISRINRITDIQFYNLGGEIDLPDYAFYQDIALAYIGGNQLNVKGTNIFTDDRSYTLCSQSGTNSGTGGVYLTPLYVPQTTTSVASLFAITNGFTGSIGLAAAKQFINTDSIWGNRGAITNVSNMFLNQGIAYSETNLKSDLAGSTKLYLDMSGFTNVTNVTRCFAGNQITALHYNMFSFGSNSSAIDITGYVNPRNYQEISTPIDIMKNIIEKINVIWNSEWWWNGYGWYGVLKVVDSSCNALSTVKLSDFFHPGGKHPLKVTSLQYLGFSSSNTTIDFTGAFDNATTNWPSLTSIYGFLWNRKYTGVIAFDGLLYSLTSGTTIKSIRASFNIDTTDNPIRLWTFINWPQFIKNAGSTSTLIDNNDRSYNGLPFSKYLIDGDLDLFYNILFNVNNTDCKLTSFSSMFSNCTYYTTDSNKAVINFPDGKINYSVTSTGAMFYNFKVAKIDSSINDTHTVASIISSKEDTNLYVKLGNIFASLPKVTYAPDMFNGMYIKNTLTYDFFKKRQANTTTDIYVNTNNVALSSTLTKFYQSDSTVAASFKKGTLTKYSYTNTITSLNGCFANTSWNDGESGPKCFIPPTEVSERPNRNFIKLDDGSATYTDRTTKYYILKKDDTGYYFYESGVIAKNDENSELDDLNWTGYDGVTKKTDYIASIQSGNVTYNNFSVTTATVSNAYLFAPPDIFYGCSSSCDISHCFSTSSDKPLEGVMPEHLLKACKTVNPYNTFYGLNILPRYYWQTSTTDSSTGVTDVANVYYYIPVGFTSCTSLNQAFNFHLILPPIPVTDVSGLKVTHNDYYLLLSGSIPKSAHLFKNSTPSNSWTGYNYTNNNSLKLHHNIMYTPIVSGTTEAPVYSGSEGMDMAYYSGLRVDSMFNAYYTNVYYGNYFRSGFSLQNALKDDNSLYIWNTYNGTISSYGIFPPAASGSDFSKANIISFGNSATMTITSAMIEGSTEASIAAYKTIKDGIKVLTVNT